MSPGKTTSVDDIAREGVEPRPGIALESVPGSGERARYAASPIGLNLADAQSRLAQYGPNSMRGTPANLLRIVLQ